MWLFTTSDLKYGTLGDFRNGLGGLLGDDEPLEGEAILKVLARINASFRSITLPLTYALPLTHPHIPSRYPKDGGGAHAPRR